MSFGRGNAGLGASQHLQGWTLDNPMDAVSADERERQRRAMARREALKRFAAESAYVTPGGKLVYHVMDPYGGSIRQMMDDVPVMEADNKAVQSANLTLFDQWLKANPGMLRQ